MSTGEEPPARLDDLDTDFRFDPEKPLEPIKKAVEGADEDLIPGRVAAVIKAMASCGMDDEVRITVRAFVKKNRFFPLEDFDHIVFSATPRKGRTPAHRALTSPNRCARPMGCAAHTPRSRPGKTCSPRWSPPCTPSASPARAGSSRPPS